MSALCIGLTGGIASGKSTVGDCFAALGTSVTDADQVARDIVQPGQPALNEIVEAFGAGMLLPDGQLNRAAMRERVFSNEKERRQLEAITHPRIHNELQRCRDNSTGPYCMLMIPLLARNTSMRDLVQRVLVVDCPVEIQRKRLLMRDHISTELANAMIAAQEDRNARLAIADEVIENNANPENLQQKVRTLHDKYISLAAN